MSLAICSPRIFMEWSISAMLRPQDWSARLEFEFSEPRYSVQPMKAKQRNAIAKQTTQTQTHSEADISEMAGTMRPMGDPETQKPRNFWGIHSLGDYCTSSQLPDQGPNSCEISRGKQVIDDQGGTESGTLSGELRI